MRGKLHVEAQSLFAQNGYAYPPAHTALYYAAMKAGRLCTVEEDSEVSGRIYKIYFSSFKSAIQEAPSPAKISSIVVVFLGNLAVDEQAFTLKEESTTLPKDYY